MTKPIFSCINLTVLLLLHYCESNVEQRASATKSPLTSLVVVENVDGVEAGSDEQEQSSVPDSEGHLEVVQPSDVWQTLKPGQAVPAGSHVKLNLQTGQQEVRLGEEQLKYWTQDHREREKTYVFSPNELKRAMKKIKEDMKMADKDTEKRGSMTTKFHSLEELKKDIAQLDLLVETDFQIIKRLLEQLNSSLSTTEQKLHILHELEYLVHQVDNGQTLCTLGGFQLILKCLNSSDVKLQESSASVLGSALASNPVVQVRAVESGALQTLLTLLATTHPQQVKKKHLCYVISRMHRVISCHMEGFKSYQNYLGQMKVEFCELISQAEQKTVHDPSHDKLVRQYAEVSLKGDLLENGWCSLVPQQLKSSEHDYREKTLRALLVMAPVCLDQYRSDDFLLESLISLGDQYHGMVQAERIMGEDDGYFSEIVELIDALEVQIKR
ncbi:Nucleotide exchange factor SIL1 [Takifugu flavidus]|uniref:Nucleotide exchange factor SIL1 n=1 Tax=Takifugu flavidus TaxID=433684 RepID=A0A5C6MMA0_9TELE|nr:Nucleotide exchange factor SIL1 [Takifugu flavidus]